ncbi:MAG: hypothetical protein ACXACX_14320 [Candidatus Hodarchaeales archaeon]|jgi:hypothetical protein
MSSEKKSSKKEKTEFKTSERNMETVENAPSQESLENLLENLNFEGSLTFPNHLPLNSSEKPVVEELNEVEDILDSTNNRKNYRDLKDITKNLDSTDERGKSSMGIKGWWKRVFRNRIAGFIFGRYQLENVAKNYMTKREKFIKSVEIIFWGEEVYLILGILIAINLIAGYFISPILLILILIYTPFLLLMGSELELIMLTDERVLIEKRTIIEKISRTQQFQAVALDQVAMINYSRAPVNLGLLIFTILGFIASLMPLVMNFYSEVQLESTLTLGIPILLFLPLLYLFWFALRLTKRSIELAVIGLSQPVGIGRKKGAPVWFMIELQKILTERIHHIYHEEIKDELDDVDVEMREFPLQFSSLVKDLVKEAGDSIAKALIMQLDQEALDVEEIYRTLPNYTTAHVDDELSYLKNKTIILYNSEKNQWELNRRYNRKYLHEESQQKL